MNKRYSRFPGFALLLAVAALLLGAAAGTARAQQPSGVRAQIVSVTTGAYPSARAVVSIEGVPAGGPPITAQSFTASLDGHSAQVTAADLAATQNLPLDVLFLMDVSGSMQGAPIARAKEAATAFVNRLAPGDRVAVMAFSDDVRLLQDYTPDRALAITAINGLTAAGNTALYRATDEAARKAASSGASRRVVILLSDGAQDGVPLTITRDQAIQSAAAGATPFFTIGEGTAIDRAYLQALADATKGRYLEAPDPAGLTTLYAGIGQLLSSQYVVTFDATGAHDGSTLSLQLAIGGQTVSTTLAFKPAPDFAPPPVTLQGVAPGDTLSAGRAVTAIVGSRPGAQVTFYMDGAFVARITQPPYTYQIDPLKLAAGAHSLRAALTDASGAAAGEASVAFQSAIPAKSAGGGSGLPLLPIAAAVLAVVILASAAFALLRIRSLRSDDAESHARMLPWSAAVPSVPVPESAPEVGDGAADAEAIGDPLGLLISRAGPDLGSEYHVGGSPVGVGSGVRCGVRVNDPDLAGEEARIWVRGGHLMVHRITRLTTIVNEGTAGGWQILEPGDSFEIGQHRFEFRLLPAAAPPPSGDVPNVLRDPDRPPAATGPTPPPAPRVRRPRTTAFSDLMPRNDLGTNRD
ncbi:MAG TPA: VWA domain-containing protein [Dehalococcoidia bacterium]|nr:VWA domain-containing protein [Dehalococcoidia bacterium]